MCGRTFCFLGREPWRGWRWKSSKLLSPGPVPELARLLGTQVANWEQAESFSLAPGGDVLASGHRSPPPPSPAPVLWGNLLCLEWPVSLGLSPPAFPGRHAAKNFFCAPCCRVEPDLGCAATACESLCRTEWLGGSDVCREETQPQSLTSRRQSCL